MIVVLSVICGVCGFLLAMVKAQTEERIEEQVLLNVKGPAVNKVLAGSTNDLIKDRKKITLGEEEMVVFVGKKDNEPWGVAYEMSAGGFGGDIGVIVGFDLNTNTLAGIGVTTHKETPGVGSKVKDDNAYADNFKGKSIKDNFKIKSDGGVIDAITGATISSRGVCTAVRNGVGLFEEIKSKMK